jgi:hypothetical protein
MNNVKNKFFLFLFLIPACSFAQLELYGKFNNDGSIEPIIDYAGTKAINSKLSITFFGLVRKEWSQALIGLSYAASKSVVFSSSIGIEQGKNSPRYSGSIWLEKSKTSLLLLGELGSGRDNYLYKINLFHQLTDQFTIGASFWRYHGLGPNFRLLIPKIQSTIWVMPAYDLEINQARVMTGITLNM